MAYIHLLIIELYTHKYKIIATHIVSYHSRAENFVQICVPPEMYYYLLFGYTYVLLCLLTRSFLPRLNVHRIYPSCRRSELNDLVY